MSYQVLARKWRPSTFEEMVGQAHVLRALVNALDQQRLHHAYLFTGTRGVGKTTIARLLAKSLNCEEGVSSKPCGVCSSCTEIAEGRFVDLIEVDAASRTKVEDTRELLENVQYAPTRGRYKVYLIDEVHMLSTSSFNALLKTLEEPPPHVKFLLATTDPQKLPVTVLSRCLQFNLKNMSREHIVQHLTNILGVEQVPFDEASLWAIAEGAQGSMRDALSLTDQAIAFGEGALREQEVASMLGTVDLKRVIKLVHALFEKRIDQLMALVAEIDEHSPDYQALMTELMSTLHRVAIAQAAPNAIDNNKGDKAAIVQLAGAAYAEDVHLYYQIAAKAKPEMSFAPSERAGFEMALLRMLAFSQTPAAEVSELPELNSDAYVEAKPTTPKLEAVVETAAKNEKAATAQVEPEANVAEQHIPEVVETEAVPTQAPVEESDFSEPNEEVARTTSPNEPAAADMGFEATGHEIQSSQTDVPPWETDSTNEAQVDEVLSKVESAPIDAGSSVSAEVNTQRTQPTNEGAGKSIASTNSAASEEEVLSDEPMPVKAVWPDVSLEQNPVFWWQVTLHKLGLAGMTKTLFANSQWVGFDGRSIQLTISPNYKKIMNDSHQERLLSSLPKWLPGCEKLVFEFGPVEKTPQLWVEKLVQKANDQAYQYLKEDPFILTLVNEFNGEIERETAVPNHNPIPSGA